MLKIITFNTIGSTQDFATQFIKNLEQPTFVISKQQTKGRGRFRNRIWISENGNFHGSLCINVSSIARENVASLNQIVMHAVFNVIQRISGISTLKIKLPNDIYNDGKKLAGVLIEVFYPIAIIGIGINLTYAPLIKSTSISQICGKSIDSFDKEFINMLFNEILEMLKYLQFN